MHVVKAGIWWGEGPCGGNCVPVHFCALALDAGTGPLTYVHVDARPYVARDDEALGGSDAWMGHGV